MAYEGALHGYWCNARTYPTRCSYCGEAVFFFSCDCGCKVFFDSLGAPWPEHRCLEYLKAQYGQSFMEHAMSVQMMLPGLERRGKAIDAGYARAVQQRLQRPGAKPRQIVRCAPRAKCLVSETGIIREVMACVDLPGKLGIALESPIGYQVVRYLGGIEFRQVTIHTGDLAREDMSSYTCWAPDKLLSESGCEKGDVVRFQLVGWSFPGMAPMWLCQKLELPFGVRYGPGKGRG